MTAISRLNEMNLCLGREEQHNLWISHLSLSNDEFPKPSSSESFVVVIFDFDIGTHTGVFAREFEGIDEFEMHSPAWIIALKITTFQVIDETLRSHNQPIAFHIVWISNRIARTLYHHWLLSYLYKNRWNFHYMMLVGKIISSPLISITMKNILPYEKIFVFRNHKIIFSDYICWEMK